MTRVLPPKATGLIAGMIVAATAGGALAQQKMIIATNVPPQHWASTQGAEPLMACVKKATDNAFDFNYFPGGQIQNFNNSMDVVNGGLTQIAYLVISALSAKMPINGVYMLPGLGDSVVQMTRATRKVIDAEGPFKKEFADNKVRPLMINTFPAYQVILKSGAIESVNDVKGKKISSGGSTMTFAIRALGGSPVELPSADIYMAVQQGTIDGTVLALASIKPYNLQEVAKSMTTNAHLGSAAGIWSMDLATWEKLSPAHQKVFDECGRQVEESIAKFADEFTVKLGTELAAAGVKLFKLSPESKATFDKSLKAAQDDYVDRLEKRGLSAKAALEMYVKALGQ